MIEGERLLQAIRNRLRNNLSNVAGTTTNSHNKSIQVMPDERVPPSAGEEFIGVYGTQLGNIFRVPGSSTHITTTVSVGITRRIQAQPVDRLGDTIYTEDVEVYDRVKPSMLARVSEILNLVDGRWELIQEANTLIENGSPTSVNCFLTPLGFTSGDMQPRYVDENHFFTDDDDNKFHKGLFIELTFSGAELVIPHLPES